MEYDSKLTNSENINKLINSVLINEQTPVIVDIPGVENPFPLDKPKDDKDKYPNYCRYPKNAVLPTKNSAGVSGEEALIEGFCFYSPGIYIPVDSEIRFWDIDSISSAVDKHLKKQVKKKYREDKDELIRNFSRILPIGSVASFMVGGSEYNTWVTKPSGSPVWEFKGYYRSEDRKPYQPPKWVDSRTNYQRFVDEYGFAIQIAAAVATAAAGVLSGGAAWVLTAEIVLELGLGVAVGLRELEKGENVSAALSFITGFLPMLKMSKLFRGIPESDFIELSKNLAGAKLTNVDDYVTFYNELRSESQKMIMSKLLKQDEITKNLLLKELKTSMADELPKLIVKEFKNIVESNPKLLKSIPFFERLWARELTTNSFFIILGTLVNVIWGDKLNANAEDLKKLKGVYSVVPDELKKEIAFNLISNAEHLDKISETKSFKDIEKLMNIDKTGTSWAKWFNTKFKKATEEAGGSYTELPEDKYIAVKDTVGNKIDNKSIEDTVGNKIDNKSTKDTVGNKIDNKSIKDTVGNIRDEKELRRLGFVPFNELSDSQEVYDFTNLNDVDWFKIQK
jgi:hypothetical protein